MALHLITGYAGVEHVTSANAGALNSFEIGTGRYVFETGEKFNYNLQSNNTIRIYDGQGLMDGRHFEMVKGTYEDLSIENGAQGEYRKDLVCVRYSINNETGIESTELVVVKGTSVSENPVDPTTNTGSILNGVTKADWPLYRINIEGLSVKSVEKLFETFSGFKGAIDQINSNLTEKSDKTDTVSNIYVGEDGKLHKVINGADSVLPFSSGVEFNKREARSFSNTSSASVTATFSNKPKMIIAYEPIFNAPYYTCCALFYDAETGASFRYGGNTNYHPAITSISSDGKTYTFSKYTSYNPDFYVVSFY